MELEVKGAKAKGNQVSIKEISSVNIKPPRGWDEISPNNSTKIYLTRDLFLLVCTESNVNRNSTLLRVFLSFPSRRSIDSTAGTPVRALRKTTIL
jgi:hypothetical protein